MIFVCKCCFGEKLVVSITNKFVKNIRVVSVKKLEEGMTPEEKAALYKAIDYQENAAPAEFPKEYEDISCIFLLRILEIQLKNDDLDTPTVLNSELKGVKCRFDKRTGGRAIK